jgi:DNA-directed RNA polymerase specialized sigma subunit
MAVIQMLDAKEYLKQIRLFDANINNKLEEMQNLKEMAVKITANIKPVVVTGSHSQDKLGDAVAKIVDLQAEINRAVDSYVDKKKEISAVIEKIQNPDQLAVIHKRYFEFKTWEQIACEMNYTYRNICYIHGRALQAIEKILKEGV